MSGSGRQYALALAMLTAGLICIVVGLGLPWLVVAIVLGVVATRGRGRMVVGVLLAILGVAAVVGSLVGGMSAGAVAGAVGGILVISGAGWTVMRGDRWPSMGARYERQQRSAGTRRSAWEELDQGIDPTDPRA